MMMGGGGCGLTGATVLVLVVVVVVVAVASTPAVHALPTQGNRALYVEDLTQLLRWDTEVPTTSRNFRPKLESWLHNLKDLLSGFSESPVHAFEWIPQYIGEANPSESLSWSTPCYEHNMLHVTDLSADGAKLHLNISHPTSQACEQEFYMVATIQGLFFLQVHHAKAETHAWPGSISHEELTWIRNNGFRVLRFNGTMDDTLKSLGATLSLFLPAELTREVWEKVAERNVEFLRAKAYYDLPERTTTDVIPDESQIKDGDFFGILRLDGLDPMLAWAMGAHTGHTAIALRFDGELYVCESTTSSSYWPTNGIQKTPYRKWIKQAKEASFNVVHLPLTNAARAKFNATAARQWFLNVAEGLPYGYHNMLFAWIDLAEANYPGGLTSEAHEVLVGLVEKVDSGIAAMMWTIAFNKRLGTTNLTVAEVYNTAARRNISFTELFAMPEQDSWQYVDGYSMVCDVLVCETWKAGGLFGNLTDKIQCTEFTNWDAYTLDIFDTNTPRPTACVKADPNLPFCQILGKYRMDLPFYNTRPMVAHMAERCPRGSPPKWPKPAGC